MVFDIVSSLFNNEQLFLMLFLVLEWYIFTLLQIPVKDVLIIFKIDSYVKKQFF
jgi:hypothetical protein